MSLLILYFIGACALLKLACQFRSRHYAIRADGPEHKSCYKTGVSRNVAAGTKVLPRNIRIFLPYSLSRLTHAISALVLVENGCYLYLLSCCSNFWATTGEPRGHAGK